MLVNTLKVSCNMTNTYLDRGGGGQTKVLIILSVALRICSGTSSRKERSFKVMAGSENEIQRTIKHVGSMICWTSEHDKATLK